MVAVYLKASTVYSSYTDRIAFTSLTGSQMISVEIGLFSSSHPTHAHTLGSSFLPTSRELTKAIWSDQGKATEAATNTPNKTMLFNFINDISLHQHYARFQINPPTNKIPTIAHHSLFPTKIFIRIFQTQNMKFEGFLALWVITIVSGACQQLLLFQTLHALDEQIAYYESIDQFFSSVRKDIEYGKVVSGKNFSGFTFENRSYETIKLSELPFEGFASNCQIMGQSSIDSLLSFQTSRHIYLVVNNLQAQNYTIYNDKCAEVSKGPGAIVQSICDRKFCDHGQAIFLSSHGEILQCNENDNFTTCMKVPSNEGSGLLGAVSRTKGVSNLDIYKAHETGITVFSVQEGRQRLVVPMERGSLVSQFIDKHPFPLIVSNHGWIYSLDNTRFSLQLTKCPYIDSDIWLYIPSPYSQFIYVLTKNIIYKMELKPQSNSCFITNSVVLSSPIQLKNNEWRLAHITEYQGFIFIDNQVINLEDGTVKYFDECGQNPIFAIQPVKNNYKKGIYVLGCCQEMREQGRKCGVVIFKTDGDSENGNKGQFVAIVSALGVFIFLIYYFLKPSPSNLEDSEPEFSNTQNQAYRTQVDRLIASKASASRKQPTNKQKQRHNKPLQKQSPDKNQKVKKV